MLNVSPNTVRAWERRIAPWAYRVRATAGPLPFVDNGRTEVPSVALIEDVEVREAQA